MNSYGIGISIHLQGTFTRVSDGELVDPDVVILRVKDPAGTVTSYSSEEGDVTRQAQGIYYRDVIADKSGPWVYRFEGSGAVQTAGDQQFLATRSAVVT